MVLQTPCLYYFERYEQAIIRGNYILSPCTRLLSAGVTSEFSANYQLPIIRMPTTNQNGDTVENA